MRQSIETSVETSIETSIETQTERLCRCPRWVLIGILWCSAISLTSCRSTQEAHQTLATAPATAEKTAGRDIFAEPRSPAMLTIWVHDDKKWQESVAAAKESFGGPKVKIPVEGSLYLSHDTEQTKSIPVKVLPRGNTSLADCSFPKLRLKYSKANVAGTALHGLKNLFINTHCGVATGSDPYSQMGRLLGDAGPFREAVAYQLLRVVGFEAFRVRPATIRYLFGGKSGGGKPRVEIHSALLLENKFLGAERLGGRLVEEEEYSEQFNADVFEGIDTMKKFNITRQAALRLHFAESLLGNIDFALYMPNEDAARALSGDGPIGLWNVDLVMNGSETSLVPNDFDLASIVTGRSRTEHEKHGTSFLPKEKYLADVEFNLLKVNHDFSDEEIAQEADFWMTNIHHLKRVIDSAVFAAGDDTGRKLFTDHLAYFTNRISQDRLYEVRSGVGEFPKDMQVYLDSSMTRPCSYSYQDVVGLVPRTPLKVAPGPVDGQYVLEVFDGYGLFDYEAFQSQISSGFVSPFDATKTPCGPQQLYWQR